MRQKMVKFFVLFLLFGLVVSPFLRFFVDADNTNLAPINDGLWYTDNPLTVIINT